MIQYRVIYPNHYITLTLPRSVSYIYRTEYLDLRCSFLEAMVFAPEVHSAQVLFSEEIPLQGLGTYLIQPSKYFFITLYN
jgi:hypothetical protein